jgi:8-oxo-dGTP pyrophosphatase MutT (NUDIX family)
VTEQWARTGWVDEEALSRVPPWLRDAVATIPNTHVDDITRFSPPHGQGRHSAVLILFGEGPDLLLIRRATTLRAHAGQPAFPGGAVEEDDVDAATAAVREAQEETGLDPTGVVVFGALPDLWVPITGFVVTPVLGWWAQPSPVSVADPAEVASVHRIPIADLIDPANRVRFLHQSGYLGPGFLVDGLAVWGFTAGLINGLLDRLGLAVPWDIERVIDLPPEAAG